MGGTKTTVNETSVTSENMPGVLGLAGAAWLFSGDWWRAAELARHLRLDEYHAQLLPEGKAALLSQMKAQGAKIAFIGDGMNDAPALAGAHVGIAMQRGADLARLTSDIALLEDDVGRVADAKALAAATMRRIDGNFKFTVAANTGILAAAAAGWLTPVASSVLHNGSTIAILLNALRGGLASQSKNAPKTQNTQSTRRPRKPKAA